LKINTGIIKMGWKVVKDELLKQDKETLINHISELYKKFKPVKEYLDLYATLDEKELLVKYKNRIDKCFSYTGGFKCDPAEARRIVNDFSKLDTTPESLGIIMLYYVEECTEYIGSGLGELNQGTFSSIINYYQKGLNNLYEGGVLLKYKKTAEKIVTFCDEIGYGLYDEIYDVFINFFEDDEDGEDLEDEKKEEVKASGNSAEGEETKTEEPEEKTGPKIYPLGFK
jgi:hypothetical protein